MSLGEVIGIVLLLTVMLIGLSYHSHESTVCKLGAIDRHLSVADADTLCK